VYNIMWLHCVYVAYSKVVTIQWWCSLNSWHLQPISSFTSQEHPLYLTKCQTCQTAL